MSPGAFTLSANVIVVIHLLFVVFVVFGGLLVLRWPRLAWLHVPAAVWGVLIEYGNWICPLTPVENYLRERAGQAAYPGDFIEHYVLPLLYPARLTRNIQMLLGSIALAVNAIVYWQLIRRKRVT
jgi:Protein of Unknown function (DUF2784)